MKILVVCQYYYPEDFQITPICEQLVKDGYDLTVLTGLPNYPTGVIPDDYRKGHRKEEINGVKVIRVDEIGRKKGSLGLALNYCSFVISSMREVKKITSDFDLVFCYQLSPVMMAMSAVKYAKINHTPFILYCCDIWPESIKMYVKSEYNPIYKFIENLSKSIYKSANKIICQSSSFIPYLMRVHDIDSKKLVYIPAFAEELYLTQDFTPEDDVVDFVFLGNLGIAQNLISVLQAVEIIKDIPGFKVHFVGNGSMLDEMKKYVIRHRLENLVVFYGRRPVEEMTRYYKLADACLVSLLADNEIGLTLPAKVQGYMAAGKPIIGMVNGSTKDVIEQSGCGICVEAGNVEALATGMKDFIENRERYRDCGANARTYFIKNFRKSIFINKLEKEFESIMV